MRATEKLREKLDELGIEWWNETDPVPQMETVADIGDEIAIYHENVDGSMGYSTHNKHGLTPKQAIAATVGVDSNTEEAIRKLLDKLNTELCNAGCGIECETREERRRLIDAVKDKYAQVIATTVVNVGYGIQFADWCEFPPETMVGETVYDGEGNAIGWITNATVGREALTAEQVRECAKGVYFEGYSDGATHRANGIEDTDWQTIADKLNATLGAGTCHNKGYVDCSERYFICSSCGCEFDYSDFACEFAEHRSLGSPHYCPNCGAKVVDE